MNTLRYPQWFAEEGHRITVACLAGSPLELAARQRGIEVVTVTKARRYFDFYQARKLARIIRYKDVDVLWFRDNRDMDLLAWTKRYCKGSFRLIYHQAMQLSSAKKDFLHTWRFSQLDAWIALLAYLADQVQTLTKYPTERLHQIPLGQEKPVLEQTQEQARIALDLPTDALCIGIVGRLDPLKGQKLLMQAADLLWEKGEAVHVVFVGEATKELGKAYLTELEEYAAYLRHPEHVHFRPYTPQVTTAYLALDIFAMASDGETFGNVTIEAMLAGVCVVGSNTSGTPELLDHGKAGVLFESGNALDLADKLRVLLNDNQQRRALAKSGQQRAERMYTKGPVLTQLRAVLEA